MVNHADYEGFAEDGILNIGYGAVMGVRSKIMISGVVRQSAAWGENKKCRPCLYFLRLFEYAIQALLTVYFACPKFEFGLSGIRSFGLHYFTNH